MLTKGITKLITLEFDKLFRLEVDIEMGIGECDCIAIITIKNPSYVDLLYKNQTEDRYEQKNT